MISPILERLILEGLATPRTHVTGGSSSNHIIVPNDSVSILTDVVVNGFFVVPQIGPQDDFEPNNFLDFISALFKNGDAQMVYTDPDSKRQYNIVLRFQNDVKIISEDFTPASYYLIPGNPVNLSMYWAFRKNFVLETVAIRGIGTNFTVLPQGVNNLLPNAGLFGQQVQRQFDLNGATISYVTNWPNDQLPTDFGQFRAQPNVRLPDYRTSPLLYGVQLYPVVNHFLYDINAKVLSEYLKKR